MTEVIRHRVHIDEDEEEPQTVEDFLQESAVRLDTDFSRVLVVDNLPVVGSDRYIKLENVLKKVFGNFGPLVEDWIYMPRDEKDQTKGFAFIEFQKKEDAEQALTGADNFPLDKAHIFKVCKFDDFKRFENVPEELTTPDVKPPEFKDDLTSWLLDERTLKCIDQFVVRQGEATEVYWNDVKSGKPTLVDDASRLGWTETYVQWSPKGTYLASFHKMGVQLWGGEKWTRQARFQHPGVKLIDFSPNEQYMVSVSPQFLENDDKKDPKCIIVWDVRTGNKLRGFPGVPPSPTVPSPWPVFQWSHDDKYLAKIGEDVISIYETPSLGLLDKQSLKATGVRDFTWSPTDNIISYFIPEAGSIPARVVLVSIPSRKELRQKNAVGVKDCKLHWQSAGKYLCVKVDRMNKNKKTTQVNFEIFRIKEKDIPVEALEIKETVHAFAWEPKKDRFAIIHGENQSRPDVSFYEMTPKKLVHLKTLEKKPANLLFWSPTGDNILLAGLKQLNGQLEFFNVNDMETMANEEHPMCTAIDWDPSGRYVSTTISFWRQQLETGYNLYTFAGKPIYKVLKDRFCQMLWRPRPDTKLSAKQIDDIKKNFQKYEDKYNLEDKLEQEKFQEEFRRGREALRKAFTDIIDERMKEYEAKKADYMRVWGRDPLQAEKDTEEIAEEVEELLDIEEVVV
eukprot:TRINITY_DN933_c0_g2_i1.p1 TRINITY_DN933_c0_g2~~TRINITY_DN933_c0_g2_i1.p1  ORF type:complete len:700 (+),score=232.01 TRINITY_DN933_c0_g2_i1:67-2100(+)